MKNKIQLEDNTLYLVKYNGKIPDFIPGDYIMLCTKNTRLNILSKDLYNEEQSKYISGGGVYNNLKKHYKLFFEFLNSNFYNVDLDNSIIEYSVMTYEIDKYKLSMENRIEKNKIKAFNLIAKIDTVPFSYSTNIFKFDKENTITIKQIEFIEKLSFNGDVINIRPELNDSRFMDAVKLLSKEKANKLINILKGKLFETTNNNLFLKFIY